MSSNLGLFASVCLASRLPDHTDVFALMLLSVVLFTLVPSFRKYCQVILIYLTKHQLEIRSHVFVILKNYNISLVKTRTHVNPKVTVLRDSSLKFLLIVIN